MKTEEILEGNKLIAEFMEHKKDEDTPFYTISVFNPITFNQNRHHEEQLCFHISWDWLMPVVEKINNNLFVVIVKYGLDRITVKIKQNYDESIIVASGSDDTMHPIEAYYQAVIEFIKWYNLK